MAFHHLEQLVFISCHLGTNILLLEKLVFPLQLAPIQMKYNNNMLSFLVPILFTTSSVFSHPIHVLVDPTHQTRGLDVGVSRGRDSAHPILLRDVDFSAPIQGRGTITVHKAVGVTGAWKGAAGPAMDKAQHELDAATVAQKKAKQSIDSIKSKAGKTYAQSDKASAKLFG